MSTLKAKIEAYVGDTTAETSYLADYLATAIARLINAIPAPLIQDHAVGTAVNSAGLDISAARVFSVYGSGIGMPAREIPASESLMYQISGSLKKATTADPVYWTHGQKLYVLDSGTDGIAFIINAPLPTAITPASDTEIDVLPTPFESAAIIDAAQMVAVKRFSAAVAAINALVAPTVPTVLTPSTPSYGSLQTAPTAPTALDITTQLTSLATYLDTQQDIELASGKLNEINTRIDNYRSQLQKFGQDITIYSEKIKEAVAKYEGDIQLYQANIQKYVADIQRYNDQIAGYQAQISQYQQVITGNVLLIQNLKQMYNEMIMSLLGFVPGMNNKGGQQ